MRRRSQILGKASLQNISKKICGTPLVDLRRSLLTKYFRKQIWNAVRKSQAKPLVKYFRKQIWNAVRRSSAKPLEKIFQRRQCGTPFVDLRRSLPPYKIFQRRYLENQLQMSDEASCKIFQKANMERRSYILDGASCKIFQKDVMERRSQILDGASLKNILEEIFGTPITDCR